MFKNTQCIECNVLVFILHYGKYYFGPVVTHEENISSC